MNNEPVAIASALIGIPNGVTVNINQQAEWGGKAGRAVVRFVTF
jgi:hypothetical protein